jgi:5,10-methylenetetrahydrofolate reductase
VSLVDRLAGDGILVAAELRPPRAELGAAAGIDAWIDTYHSVRRLTRQGTYVFLTDSAVGVSEEDNLRHLIANLGADVPLERIVPFLTTKHSMAYCLGYAERARQHGFSTLVVLGGDRSVGPARAVEHAWQLREAIRTREPSLRLGGWANPYADPMRQIDHLIDPRCTAEFFLTQIVSHHRLAPVERFVRAARERGLAQPGLFGVFYYRSANPRTLAALAGFLPVPAEELTREFGQGASPEEVCARTVRGLLDLGVRHFYISNLPLGRASAVLRSVVDLAGARTA